VALQPEDIQIGLVARDQGVVIEIFEALGFHARMAIIRTIAIDEVLQVFTLQRLGFQDEMLFMVCLGISCAE